MRKRTALLMLGICSLLPLLFTTTIPYVLPTRLNLDSIKMSQHSWTNEFKSYVIGLEEGSQYTIFVDISVFWGMDISLRIGEAPYMINGFSVESGSNTGERMHFTASKTGDYYIQVKVNSGSGYFDIIVESGLTGSATGSNTEFFNGLLVLIFILPSVIILAVGILLIRIISSKTKKAPTLNKYMVGYEEKKDGIGTKEEMTVCEYCGTEIKNHLKKCPNCQTSLL